MKEYKANEHLILSCPILEALVESLDKTCTRYKMEISAEKTKLMTNSANGIQREIKGIKAEAGYCNKLQVPWSSCFR